jgi:propionyl-CoA carboxylase beta chain
MTAVEHPDLAALAALEREAAAGGGEDAQRRQKRLGRMLVRERVDALVDPGSFLEVGAFVRSRASGERAERRWGDGVVAGTARIVGRPVIVYAHDATVHRGAVGVAGAEKILRVLRIAEEQRLPVVSLLDSDGARVSEGQHIVPAVARVLRQIARLSGHVPQVSVALGLCGGAAAYGAALSDVVIAQAGRSYLFVTGSKVTQVVTGQDASLEDLGGAAMHAKRTGLVHLQHAEERGCLDLARAVLSYLPGGAGAPAPAPVDDPVDRATPEVMDVLPASLRRAYDVRKIVRIVFDAQSFLELQAAYARSVVVGLARLGGRPVGVVASQPAVYAGALDSDSARKGARFVQLCSAHGLPVVTLADVPGFRPGVREEQEGLLLHGAKLISAYACCRTPIVTLILRKAYGGGNVLTMPGDVRLALPFARVQPMGTEAALAVVTHRTFGEIPADELAAFRAKFERDYDATHLAPEAGIVDRVVHPENVRRELCQLLASLDPAPRRRVPTTGHVNGPC